jgi:hypothetical protein
VARSETPVADAQLVEIPSCTACTASHRLASETLQAILARISDAWAFSQSTGCNMGNESDADKLRETVPGVLPFDEDTDTIYRPHVFQPIPPTSGSSLGQPKVPRTLASRVAAMMRSVVPLRRLT